MSRSNLLDSPRALHEPLYVERNELSALVPNSVTTYGSESFSESQTPLVVVKPYHTPFFTFLAIFANCVMFVVSIWKNGWHIESMSANPMLGPSSDTLLSLGAKQASLIRLGQWWRLFAPQYLHAGMIHLLMNMSGLWSLGRGLESEFGFLRIACIYTVSGLSGVLGSAVFIPEIVGVGASGALYGLVGALLADFALNHKTIEGKWAYFIRLMFSVAFGLALGLLPLVDNYAHIFGLLCGFCMGTTLLAPKCFDIGYDSNRRKTYVWYGECLAIVCGIAVLTWLGGAFYVLYSNVDAYEWCSWCKYLSCLPTPWWTCPSAVPMCQFTNGTHSYIGPCPKPKLP